MAVSQVVSSNPVVAQNNLGLVHFTIQKYFPEWLTSNHPYFSYADLFQTGAVGLVKAQKKYDPAKSSFSTFAILFIRTEILHAFRDYETNNPPLSKEVSMETKIEEGSDGDPFTIGNLIDIRYARDPMTAAIDRVDVHRGLEKLNRVEKFIIRHRFGLGGAKIMNQADIAKILGCSQVHVSRIERKALKKLREYLQGA